MLLIIYKMVDGELPVGPGLGSLVLIMGILAMTISTQAGFLQGTVFVISLAGLASFSFLAEQFEIAALRKFETEKLIEIYNKYLDRPDNISALFEIAKRLHRQGLKGNAIALTQNALDSLSKNLDPVSNKSFRDTFRNEEYMLKNWQREAAADPRIMRPMACPNCKTVNPLVNFYCTKCQRPYVMDIAYDKHVKPTIYGKLLVSFAMVATIVVGSAFIGVTFSGLLAVVMLVVLLGAAGGAIYWMFRDNQGVI
ncbi:MAG TPA: hypothetical protein VGL56_11795 [Fimbriimonadaceae bacterium]|jgi:hypothetical protein